ncbi:LuxR C-terminal-related transcriptional regulator [Streptomyces nanhaiensis]|uniref:LuxR C-terminal-related transcriptional regulator n=1 Tax=Streptomyces nanhaiensis TaxID=679319 RepID=UPI00399D304B
MPRALDGHLSPGQLAALRLAANGMTSREIARILGTTEQGIHLRLKTASKSLGAASRTHAVALALKRGLLDLDDVTDPRRPAGLVPEVSIRRRFHHGRRIRTVPLTGDRL